MEKDDYVLKAHVRHEKKDILDKMMDIPMSMAVKVIYLAKMTNFTRIVSPKLIPISHNINILYIYT